MRNNYFDFNNWSRESMEPQRWEPGERPGPYGEIPGEARALREEVGRRPQGRQSRPARRERRRGARPGERADGSTGFFFLLAMILISVCVALYFQGGLPALPAQGSWDWEEWDGWRRYDYIEGYEELDWVEELKDTTIPRAPVGGEASLLLTPAGETALTPQEIYRQVGPSVVGIRTFAGQDIYMGTGIILTSDGYIITNAHVIAGGRRADVVFSDNTKAEALLVGYDQGTDLAVLKIDRTELPAATFGDSSQLQVGDPAYAIGNPLGEELYGTMTDGMISAIDRAVDMDGQSMTLLQTTAALNSGNSGGALINAAGQVVGVTNMKMMSEWETIEGLGFAVPSALTKEVVDQIIATGSYVGQPALGIKVKDHFDGSGEPDGAEVSSVKEASGAYGLLYTGDIIISANGEPVTSTKDLLRIREGLGAGEELHLVVWAGTLPGGEERRLLEISFPLGYSNAINDSEDSVQRRD
ncbi:MAG: serine protease [Oscillospiraceae bacterium]|nr:serine protease [Oscillospiraceae bacterium]